ncbi:lipopolysaccharide biosynthesis protein [Pontibacter vulgaris]|uniref:lipopolysaccharide biosynthesis protein n=1 Tax=Pontibacter vulgaris TaxID=2905679 RepID=UPI001FA711ED|nr:oligosaccharide flippase family protein [Pontibacter vulgaris]
MLRKLLSHAAIYGLSAQLPRLAGVLVLPVITRYLTTTDYGVAGVVTAYASALLMLQSLGLSVVLTNTYARHPDKYSWVWRQLNGFISLFSLGYGLLMITVLYLVVPPEAHEHRLWIALLYSLPAMLFVSTEMQTSLYYQLSQRPLPLAVRAFVVGAVTVALNVYTIAYLRMGYMGWFYANFFGQLFGFVVNCYSLYFRQGLWPIFNFKWYRVRSALKIALPVVPHNMSFFLMDTSDRLVLDVLRVPLARIGLYNVASSFGTYFMIASSAIVQAASPFYLQFYKQEAGEQGAMQARRMTFALQILFLVATTIGSLWMKEIFSLLIKNKDLQQAYTLAIIILMGYNFRPMYLAVMNLLVYRENTNKLWRISAVAGVGNVLLNFILVPVFGFQAAAFTTFAALMYMGYAGFLLKEYKQAALVKLYPLVWLSITVAALLVVYNLADMVMISKVWLTGGVSIAFGLLAYFNRNKINGF